MTNNKKYHYTDEELKFIEHNYKSKTDKEIAQILGRNEESVGRQRKKYGWTKKNGRPTRDSRKENIVEAVKFNTKSGFSISTLDKNQRLEIYKQNFNNNHRYKYVKDELTESELEYYKHKYVDFMDSVDTITPQEEDSLHHMLMTDINISRIRRQIKKMEDLSEEDDSNPLAFGLYDTLEKAEKRYLEYQKALNVTREKRLQKEREQKETITSIVSAYKDKLVRQEMGRQAGLMELFQKKCEEDMSTHRYLLGDL